MPFRKSRTLDDNSDVYIIAGLGNPGKKYDGTRHNIGFDVVDVLALKFGEKIRKLKFQSLYTLVKHGQNRILLLKPQTYMNESGRAIRQAADFYKVPSERILVVVDDIHLSTGRLRMREGGSDGGHNGLKSILYQLQSDRFPRLRVGVGAPGENDRLTDFVLDGFSKEESRLIEHAVQNAVEVCEMFVSSGFAAAANAIKNL
ncbi:MAG: aminoacyl-tRNA hydrolase [Oscillospiraceae bacterium]|nr:aminoacyl-tRNA hydrolase [Oscillospiraceae bacterium]